MRRSITRLCAFLEGRISPGATVVYNRLINDPGDLITNEVGQVLKVPAGYGINLTDGLGSGMINDRGDRVCRG